MSSSFQYFATFDDSLEILRDLCAQGFSVVAEPAPFDEPAAPLFTGISAALIEILRTAPNFYLSGSFTRFPVQFNHFASGPAAGKYGINLLAQGPLMQSMVGRLNVVDGTPTLLPGDTSYEDAYRNPETQEWEDASAELKAAYRKVVATIKKHCPRHTYKPGMNLFIGPAALDLLNKGEAQINEALVIK